MISSQGAQSAVGAMSSGVFEDLGHIQVGDARFVRDSTEADSAEFGIAVADAWQGMGLGRRLLQATIAAAHANGVKQLYGGVLRDNLPMLVLVKANGFASRRHPDDPRLVRVQRLLEQPVAATEPRTPHPTDAPAWDLPRRQSPAIGW